MRTLSLAPLLALSLPLAACTRAQFAQVDAAGSDGGAAGALEVSPEASPEASVCVAPRVCESQKPAGVLCDPVCQVGACDWCKQKCGYRSDGNPTCASLGVLPTGSACTVSLAGTADQSDNCAPGNVCLTPDSGSGLSYCFTLCRSSLDCAGVGVACSERVLSGSGAAQVPVAVCDPPYRSCAPNSPQPCCDPLGDVSGCGAGQFCYLVSSDPSHDNRTVCDYTTGGGGRGQQCAASRDCMSGWTCFGASSGIAGLCRRVCDPKVVNPCGPGGGPCGDYGNQYGVCPP